MSPRALKGVQPAGHDDIRTNRCFNKKQVTKALTNTYIRYEGYNTVVLKHSAVNVLQLLEAIKGLLPNKLGAVDINELSLYPSENPDGIASPVEPYPSTSLFEEINGGNSLKMPFIVRRKSNYCLFSRLAMCG